MQLSKRIFDLVVTGLSLIIFLPLMLGIGILVWIFLGTPVLFRQQRPGYKGKPFITYKFRSMTDQRRPDGSLLPDVERLTRFGRFLRSTSLDDLPQLWNVLKGEMSMVGPRAYRFDELKEYEEKYPVCKQNIDIIRTAKPGITGLWQTSGRNDLNFEQRAQLDAKYIINRSLRQEIFILLKTPFAMLSRW